MRRGGGGVGERKNLIVAFGAKWYFRDNTQ